MLNILKMEKTSTLKLGIWGFFPLSAKQKLQGAICLQGEARKAESWECKQGGIKGGLSLVIFKAAEGKGLK